MLTLLWCTTLTKGPKMGTESDPSNPTADVEDASKHLNKNPVGGRAEEVSRTCQIWWLYWHDMLQELKELPFSCRKTFQIFYNSNNAFDSETALLQNINWIFVIQIWTELRHLWRLMVLAIEEPINCSLNQKEGTFQLENKAWIETWSKGFIA